MRTLTTLLIASATAFSLNASANSYLGTSADEEYRYNDFNNFTPVTQTVSDNTASYLNEMADEIYNDGVNGNQNTIAGVLNELETNPSAAGRSSTNLADNFYLNETVDEEYQN